MTTEPIFSYLRALAAHNEREWYHAHKEELQAANTEFEQLLSALILRMSETDPSIAYLQPRNIIFRMMRDTRFCLDKTPYHLCFRAHIGPKGKAFIPAGYYLSLQPGDQSFIAGGMYADGLKEPTTLIRNHIATFPREWQQIVGNPAFAKEFTVQGTKLKNVPRDYDPLHPQAEYLKHKSWYVEHNLPDSLVANPTRLVEETTRLFTLMQPFNAFLNEALEGYEVPKRGI